MSKRSPILLDAGELRTRTTNDTTLIGSEQGYIDFDSMMITGTSNASIDDIVFPRDVLYNGVSSYLIPAGTLVIFYTGTFWALNATKTDNYWDCICTSPTQLGVYKQVNGTFNAVIHGSITSNGSGDKAGTSFSSNGTLGSCHITTDTLTINQARVFFDEAANAYRLDIFEDGPVAWMVQSNNNNVFCVPSGNHDDYAIQTFQSLLIGTDETDVTTAGFDATFIPCNTDVTGADLGVTEWIYTSNFRTDGNHYTDNLTDDTSLEIAGIEHNAALGVQINTPDTRPHWGENGQAIFARDTRRFSIKYGAPTLNYPEFPDYREQGDMYEEYMDALEKYKSYYAAHRQIPTSLTSTNHPCTTNINFQYYSGVARPDGSVAYLQYNEPYHLICDPDGSLSYTSNGNGGGYDFALCPYNDRVYQAPYASANFRSWDLDGNSYADNAVAGANWTSLGFQGLAVANDNTLHAVPSGAEDEIIKIDPTTNTVSYYGTATTSNYTNTFTRGVTMNDGCIWCAPSGALNGDLSVRKIDPVAETVTDYSLGMSASTLNGAKTGAIGYKDNLVWFQSDDQDRGFYKYNSTTNTASRIGNVISGGLEVRKFVLAPDGLIYVAAQDIGIYCIDVDGNSVELIYSDANCYGVLCLTSSGKAFLADTDFVGVGVGGFSPIQSFDLFDVEIDPNFLCNRYLNTT